MTGTAPRFPVEREHAIVRLDFADGVKPGTATAFVRALAEQVTQDEDVAAVNIRSYGLAPAFHTDPRRDALVERAFSKWTAERATEASEEIEALADALQQSEDERTKLLCLLDAYDRAELSLCLERDRIAERARKALGAAINAEATLILRQLTGDDRYEEQPENEWAAALTIVCGLLAGAHIDSVTEASRLPKDKVREFAQRLTENQIWKNGSTLVDANLDNDGEGEVWLWLASLVADGEMVHLPEGYTLAETGSK